MARPPAGRAFLLIGAITGLGYLTMKLATPSDEKFYNSLSPELKRRVDDARSAEARKQQFEKMKASAEAGEPIFQDSASKGSR